jgi:hypothetical protein
VSAYPRLTIEEHQELARLRADFREWVFSAVTGRWVAEKHLEDGLIVVDKPDPQSLRERVEHHDR